MPITNFHPRFAIFTLLLVLGLADAARAQTDNPVYVDDSPQAWEQFRQAQDQTRNNGGEAVRLYQELLDDFGLKLIPVSANSSDQFQAVRRRVLDDLIANPPLLERYRIIQKQSAEQMLQSNDLERLAMTRSLTDAGLEALLRLAQRELEFGRFRAASTWLEQARTHPLFLNPGPATARLAAHTQYMSGTAAHYLNDTAASRQAITDLSKLGAEAEPLRTALEKLLSAPASGPASAESPAISTLDRGRASDLNDLVAQAIWSVPLEDSLARRRAAAAQEEQPLGLQGGFGDPRPRDSDLTTAVPTVSGELVYINEGQTILALNRLTGRQLWAYSNFARPSLMDRDVLGSLDPSVVAVSNGSIVTLTGHAQPTSRSEAGRVICIDADTGSFRWSAPLTGLVEAPSNEQLFAHGAPIIADDMVFVAARRVSTQSMTSAYVVALNLNDGQVRWVRYITSSGGLRVGQRPFCTLVYAQGALFISTAVGAIARLDPTTGETAWLVRFNAPMNPTLADQSRRPWELAGPVVTSHGVITVQPDQRRVVKLDPKTGNQLESYASSSAADWNSPKYLLADDEHVYAIGNEIRAFRLDNLENVTWGMGPTFAARMSIQKGEADPQDAAGQTSNPFELRGRVQLVDGALIAPTSEGILVIDSHTGTVLNRLAVPTVGNPLAIDSQLLLACGDRLDSYMSFDRAERMLRDRIAQTPSDPEPAISLVRLGMRVRKLDLALEAAGLARRSIDSTLRPANTGPNAAPDRREELMSLLLELAASHIQSTTEEGERLYAVMNAVAVESQQRVEYLLSYGDWLATLPAGLNRAVESYQSILSDHLLAESWRIDNATMRPSAAWARQRLNDLISKRGQAAYAPQADFAAVRLNQITTGAPTVEELRSLADEYPFADAAVDAATLAANMQLQAGDARAAGATLLQAYRAAPRRPAAEKLLGRFVTIATSTKANNQIEAVMRHVVTAHGDDIALITESGSINAAKWLETAAKTRNASGRRLPTMGDLASVHEAPSIPGSLVPLYRSASTFASASTGEPALPADRALIREGNAIRMLGPRDANPIWSATLPGESQAPQLLRFTDTDVLLWMAADPKDPKAIMFSAKDGSLRWTSPRLTDLLSDPLRDLGRARTIRDQMPDGDVFDPLATLPVLNDQSIFFVQRNGGVVAIDLNDGKQERWKRKQTLEQVHAVALHDNALVLAGMTRSVGDGGELTPRLLILDPLTGDPLFENANVMRTLGRGGVKWMRISPLGVLILGTEQGLHAIDLANGKRLWSSSNPDVIDSQRGWLDDSSGGSDRIVIEDRLGHLRTLNLADGSASAETFEQPLRGEWDPAELRGLSIVANRVIAHYPQRIVVYDAAKGTIIGADVISDERDYRFLLPAQDKLLLVNSRSSQIPIPDQPGRRAQRWDYRLYSLSENCKVLGDVKALDHSLNERVLQAVLIDNCLLLSTQSETLALRFGK